MWTRINQEKRRWLENYEKDNRLFIKDYSFKPGNLVLVRNSEVKASLDRKMKPRYLGPMIVMLRTQGRSYMIAKLDRAVYHHKVVAFRAIPYFARERILLPEKLEDMSGISETTLRRIEDIDEYKEEVLK